MSTLSLFVTPDVVITTIYGATNEDKVSITATLDFSANASLFCPVTISWLELVADAHYSDVIMSAIGLKSPASRLFNQPFVEA